MSATLYGRGKVASAASMRSIQFCNSKPMVLAVVFVAAFAAFGGVKVDRNFLDALLRLPSESGNVVELVRVVDFTRDWLASRNLYCTVETNNAGRLGLYAATKPGKRHDYLFVSHVDVVKAPKWMYTPRYEDGKVFTRGACDTKGNVAVIAQTLANLVGKHHIEGLFLQRISIIEQP